MTRKNKLLFQDNIWGVDTIHTIWDVVKKIGTEKYGLDFYPPRFELIDYEGMLNAYATVALPGLYSHWSFGKQYVEEYNKYLNTHSLAFEVVINSNPSICYLMDSNTATMQALVIAHAAVGHSSFFKNNYMFKAHTQADTIISFLARSAARIKEIEQEAGYLVVEDWLDLIHMLKYVSFDKHPKTFVSKKDRQQNSKDIITAKDLRKDKVLDFTLAKRFSFHDDSMPETYIMGDNVLKFISDHSLNMPPLQRELIRIILQVNQYLFPQVHTQLMNEGWASFWHYTIMNDLYEQGYINEGSYWEFMQVHSSVLNQRSIKEHNVAINPYKLGFDMFMDIKRISMEPTAEDKDFFPDWAGNGDWLKTIKYAMENYKDESFVEQYMSPKIVRDYKFIVLERDLNEGVGTVVSIHSPQYYDKVIHEVSMSYDFFRKLPQVICGIDMEKRERLSISTHVSDITKQSVSEETLSLIEDACGQLWNGPVEVEDWVGEFYGI